MNRGVAHRHGLAPLLPDGAFLFSESVLDMLCSLFAQHARPFVGIMDIGRSLEFSKSRGSQRVEVVDGDTFLGHDLPGRRIVE